MNSDQQLRRTALFACQVELGARMVPFAGWEMPVQFSGVRQEHEAVRQHAGLFDLGHMGRVRLHGATAAAWLEARCTRRLADMAIGQVRYGLLTTDSGGVIDDILVTRRAPTDWHLVLNASNTASVLADWQPAVPPDLKLSDHTDDEAMLAVQGPHAAALLAQVALPLSDDVKKYRCVQQMWHEQPLWLSRTGYTGEDGAEVFGAPAAIEQLFRALHAAGATPCGLGARDTLRLEAGMPLYGHELDRDHTPIAAGLGFAVRDGGGFPGAERLSAEKRHGPSEQLVGLIGDGRRPPRAAYPVLDPAGTVIGHIASGTLAPSLGQPIATAYVPAALATPGTAVLVDIRGREQLPMRVVTLPFYRRPR